MSEDKNATQSDAAETIYAEAEGNGLPDDQDKRNYKDVTPDVVTSQEQKNELPLSASGNSRTADCSKQSQKSDHGTNRSIKAADLPKEVLDDIVNRAVLKVEQLNKQNTERDLASSEQFNNRVDAFFKENSEIVGKVVSVFNQAKTLHDTIEKMRSNIHDELKETIKKYDEDYHNKVSTIFEQVNASVKKDRDAITSSSETLRNASDKFVGQIESTTVGVRKQLNKSCLIHFFAIICILLVFCINYSLLKWWKDDLYREAESLKQEQSAVKADIASSKKELAALEIRSADFASRAGKATLSNCNGRLCVRVDTNAQQYKANDGKSEAVFMVIFGY